MITHTRLLELMRYEPETGQFVYLTGKRVGQPAGTLMASRPYKYRKGSSIAYWTVSIGGRSYFRAKLAWFYMTGEYPDCQVDHRDTHSLNDRWSNLRLATQALNNANRRVFRNNKCGQKGVHYRTELKKWRAMISTGGKNRSLGHFESFEDAAAAYEIAAKEAFGEFARAA